MRLIGIAMTVAALGLSGRAQLPAQQTPDTMMGEELYAAYLASGPGILAKAFPTNQRYEAFRNNFHDRVYDGWALLPRAPSKAMFMLDIALAAFPHGYLYWADFLQLGQTYLRTRSAPIGLNAELDAFELQWNKTAIAVLAGRRQPDLVDTLVRPLIAENRIVPVPLANRQALVDPWIALIAGFVEEGYIIEDPKRIPDRGPRAIAAYEKAAAFEATRAEATVRIARLLLDSSRPSDALAVLDKFDDAWTTEGVLHYWARLLRGKTLAVLDRPDLAKAAYQSALELLPSAQSPRIGIMAIEAKRGRAAIAEAISTDVRTAPDPVNDPWWIYAHGDVRFFPQWEKALRAMVTK